MRVFISADIEGTATAVTRASVISGGADYGSYRREMSLEVAAAARGACAAGAGHVLIKDAHGHATNLEPELLPEAAVLNRGWSMDPRLMMDGLDGSYDAAFLVGYHDGAGTGGNCLGHTLSSARVQALRVNGAPASELTLSALTASYYRVPVALVTGDGALCRSAGALLPGVTAVAVREDRGASADCRHPLAVCREIEAAAQRALAGPLPALLPLPRHFRVEVCCKDPAFAYARSFYPGAALAGDTVRFESGDWYEVLRFLTAVIMW